MPTNWPGQRHHQL
ncbi:hypothetical protein PENSOL_c049G01568, partial [Penicillium solitum]